MAATLRDTYRLHRNYWRWRLQGERGAAPHLVKRRVVKQYAQEYGLSVCVETGTFCGDMIAAIADDFREIHSIELSSTYHARARQRFAERSHIHLHLGDSGRMLPRVLEQLTRPALFWLDGHYSGGQTARGDSDTPIVQELLAIFRHSVRGHVILVDDAREFRGDNDYPTIEEVRRLAAQHGRPQVEVDCDIIRIRPPAVALTRAA